MAEGYTIEMESSKYGKVERNMIRHGTQNYKERLSVEKKSFKVLENYEGRKGLFLVIYKNRYTFSSNKPRFVTPTIRLTTDFYIRNPSDASVFKHMPLRQNTFEKNADDYGTFTVTIDNSHNLNLYAVMKVEIYHISDGGKEKRLGGYQSTVLVEKLKIK